MIEISPIILGGIGAAGLIFLAWYSSRHRADETKRELDAALRREKLRLTRMAEMRAAYKLAKEELGEEPTVDQIFLTRDSLREDRIDGTTRDG